MQIFDFTNTEIFETVNLHDPIYRKHILKLVSLYFFRKHKQKIAAYLPHMILNGRLENSERVFYSYNIIFINIYSTVETLFYLKLRKKHMNYIVVVTKPLLKYLS